MTEPEPVTAICKRCGKPFVPKPTRIKTVPMTRHCEHCFARNLIDGMDLPTPPDLLDRYTKNPALTEAEFKAKLKEL